MSTDVVHAKFAGLIELLGVTPVPGFLYGFTQPGLRVTFNEHHAYGRVGVFEMAWTGLAQSPDKARHVVVNLQGQSTLSDCAHGLAEGLYRLQMSAGLNVDLVKTVVEKHPASIENAQPHAAMAESVGRQVSMWVQHAEPELMATLLPTLVDGLNRLWHEGVTFQDEWNSLLKSCIAKLSKLVPVGTNHHHLIREAALLGMPMIKLPGRVLQLGWGHHSRLFNSTLSDATGAIATAWAKDKRATHHLLRMGGLPVPSQTAVAELDEALLAAKRMGYPVVLKPAMFDQGIGVEADLQDEQALREAFPRSSAHTRILVVEKHFHGEDYRVYVIQGQMIAAAHRIPAQVVGDGFSNVMALLEKENLRRATASSLASVYKPIDFDDEARQMLERQGLLEVSVPQRGQVVRLRRAANSSRGGRSMDVTATVHPDNKVLCERAAALLRLDIAGLDLLMPDISRSWREVGAAFCEVNAQPQMGGAQPWIFRALLQKYVKGRGRIPVVLVLGSLENQAPAQALAKTLHQEGQRVVYAGGPVGRLFNAGRAALMDPRVALLVLMTDGQGLQDLGLPVDGFDVLVVTSSCQAMPDFAEILAFLLHQLSGGVVLDSDIPIKSEVAVICRRLAGELRVVHSSESEGMASVVKNGLHSLNVDLSKKVNS